MIPGLWRVTGPTGGTVSKILVPGDIPGELRDGQHHPELGAVFVGDRGVVMLHSLIQGSRYFQILSEPDLEFVHIVDGYIVAGGPRDGIFYSKDGADWHRILNLQENAWIHLFRAGGRHYLLDQSGRRTVFSSRFFAESTPAPAWTLRLPSAPTLEDRFFAKAIEFERIIAGSESMEDLHAPCAANPSQD
ncbi:MAG: hypothetical protein LR015_00470 [Verrucomicrobia bacterium]|nr:hypothetical protein [Verrucomicrobiota bacterium]